MVVTGKPSQIASATFSILKNTFKKGISDYLVIPGTSIKNDEKVSRIIAIRSSR